jgi:transcriptional regulator with PAS, ATPase and Fis domain
MGKGKFELADKGTIFLDEIGELPLHAQVKFLRVLQEKQIYRIGSEKSISVDVRIIAATNKNLSEEVEKGNFREDLYYRLNVVNLEIPPLRDRKDDIPVLAEYFLMEFSKDYDKKIKYFEVEALNYLMDYEWKGNVRELKNVIERSVLVANDEEELLLKNHLPKEITGLDLNDDINDNKEKTLADYEKMIIENTLKRYEGNKTKTAEVLGIKRQTL